MPFVSLTQAGVCASLLGGRWGSGGGRRSGGSGLGGREKQAVFDLVARPLVLHSHV